jgi:NAD(P)-dependent dehydrogenase (short-subunit alcohol dehydrogenase family)
MTGPNESSMSDAVAVVTGAGSGLGAAIANRLSAAGASVVLVDLDAGAATAVASALPAERTTVVQADVSDESDVDRYMAEAIARFGRLDKFVNNAGVLGSRTLLADTSVADYERTMGINARGAFLGLRAAIRQFHLQGGGGAIVNIASVAGQHGSRNIGPYVASKHAVIGLTRTAALEVALDGIRVNAVCPGAMETALLTADDQPWDIRERMLEIIPMRQIGDPRDVAALAVWLLTDEAAFVTGSILNVDGGQTA